MMNRIFMINSFFDFHFFSLTLASQFIPINGIMATIIKKPVPYNLVSFSISFVIVILAD